VRGTAVQRAGNRLRIEPALGDDERTAIVGCRLLELGEALPDTGGRARQLRR
jgi:hypothetical protein